MKGMMGPLMQLMSMPTAAQGMMAPVRQGTRPNADGSVSTHLMSTETDGAGNWFSFPRLFQNPDGSWLDLSEGDDWEPAYEEAKRRGELKEFGSDKQRALDYGKGSWKPND